MLSRTESVHCRISGQGRTSGRGALVCLPGTARYLERRLPGTIQRRPECQVAVLYPRPGSLALLLYLAGGRSPSEGVQTSRLGGQVQISGVALS